MNELENNDLNITVRRTNFPQFVEQTIKEYETTPAKGLVHGFQKDIIQNGWGHRENIKSGNGWGFLIKYINNDKGEFVIVEDIGATGLIGNNYSQEEIDDYVDKHGGLPPNEKLARFSTLFNSGNNSDVGSAGLFGRGKIMYQAVSKELEYFYDSYTADNKYVANYINSKQQMFKKAKEEEVAKEFIFDRTGLLPKTTHGTRIIISHPKEEVVEAIKSGLILEYINETWWMIFKKYNAKVEVYYNDDLVGIGKVPDFYNKYFNDSKCYGEFSNYIVDDGYRVKRFGLFCVDEDDTIPDGLDNICYYRNNMKIGEVFYAAELPIDDKYKKRLCGFIEFDKEWELELEKNEDIKHYGPINKVRIEFQNIKRTMRDKIDLFAIQKGLKKRAEKQNNSEKIEELVNDFADFLHDCDFNFDWDSNIGKKSNSPVLIELKKYYPNAENRVLERDQKMGFIYSVQNDSRYKEFKIIVKISTSIKNEKIFSEDIINLEEKKYVSPKIEIPFNEFYENARNLVTVIISSTEKEEIKDAAYFPVFVNMDDEETPDDFDFKIINFDFPNDNRTVNYGQSIKNVKLSISNNTNSNGIFAVSGFTQDVKDRNTTIEELYRDNNIIVDSGKTLEIQIGDILFDEKYMNRKGAIKIKFKLAHQSGIPGKEKGNIISQIGVTILYEIQQEDNRLNPFTTTNSPFLNDTYSKSKVEPNPNGDGGYVLDFNTNYVLYKYIFNDSETGNNMESTLLYKIFTLEEAFKAIMKIKFDKSDYSIIGKTIEEVNELTPGEINELINKVVNNYVGKYFEMRG